MKYLPSNSRGSHLSTLFSRTRIGIMATGLIVAGIVGTLTPTSSTAALACARAPHDVTVENAAQQTGTPGSTLYYFLTITNNDSIGCGKSEFLFDGTNIPGDWTVAPYRQTELVDSGESTTYAMWYTSPTNAYTDDYNFTIEVSRAEEPTVVNVPIRYTVTGGQEYPDLTSPSVSVASPSSGASLSGTSTITADASDNVGVTKVDFYIDGSVVSTSTAAPYSYAWNTATVANGTHTIQAKAYDAAGNATMSATSSVTVANPVIDTTAPTVAITSPSDGSRIAKNTTVTITASATDNIGVSKVEFYVNNVLVCTDTTSAYSCSYKLSTKPGVAYTMSAKAYDAQNNVSTNTVLVTSK